jgi:hypothetical protein
MGSLTQEPELLCAVRQTIAILTVRELEGMSVAGLLPLQTLPGNQIPVMRAYQKHAISKRVINILVSMVRIGWNCSHVLWSPCKERLLFP